MPERICRRVGCDRPTHRRSDNSGRRPFCARRCDLWQRSYEAFAAGGAALGREVESDHALFGKLLSDGLYSSEEWPPLLTELFNAYGRP